MTTNLTPTPQVYDSATANAEDLAAAVTWQAVVEADAEPLMLSRLLQKLVCQGAVIRALHYRADATSGGARVDVTFDTNPPRAQLLVKQWQTLVPVRSVRFSRCAET